MPAAGYLVLLLAAAVPEVGTDAGPTPVEVQLEGPAGCSGSEAFLASLRSRTTHIRAAEGDEPRTTLQVRLSRERGRVVGELRTIDDSGATDTRKVQGKSCDDVVQALSLTAALALDPTAVLSVSPDDSGSNATPDRSAGAGTDKATTPDTKEPAAPVLEKPAPAVKEQPQGPATVTMPAPTPRPVPGWELGVGLLGLSLLSGDFSPGAALDVQKNLSSGDVFRPALGVTLLYARDDVYRTPSTAAAALMAAEAFACPLRVSASVFTVQPCAAMWGGRLEAAGRQLTRENRVEHFWLSAGATLRFLFALGHGFSLRLEGGFQAPIFKRRYFATVPGNVIAQTPTLSPVVGLALTYGL